MKKILGHVLLATTVSACAVAGDGLDSLLSDVVEVAPRLPFDQGVPHINGPAEFGVSPGKECVFSFPVRGKRPLTFKISGKLPSGVVFDAATGRLSGRPAKEGDYPVTVTVINEVGQDEKKFTLRVHPYKIGLAPLLGWTSWNACRIDFDQAKILRIAHAMVSTGLASRGYSYVNLDSGWQACTRDKTTKALNANHRFPDMAAMVREIHSLGLHAGIYSTPMVIAFGSTVYEIFRGSRGYPVDVAESLQPPGLRRFGGIGKLSLEKEDAVCWAKWGFDYLKYDWPGCSVKYAGIMADALRATDRDFVVSLTTKCSPKFAQEYRTLANMYRNNDDTEPVWQSVCNNIRSADDWLEHTGKGSWFDLDMLAIGPMHAEFGEKRLTRDETILEFSAWALLGSPIQISCDLEKIDDFTLDVLSNEELLSVNQDTTGSAKLVKCSVEQRDGRTNKELRIYRKVLADGSAAYGFLNLGDEPVEETFDLPGKCTVCDLWSRRVLGETDTLKMRIPAHGARVFRIR